MRKKDIIKMFFNRNKLGYLNMSFSQEGEDIILANILGNIEKGIYVDIGAHHPTRFSNTYSLYLKGWSGLNVDALPGSMELFKRIRPRDINVEAGISSEGGSLTFYMFNESALNTFDSGLVEEYEKMGYKLIGTKQIDTFRAEEIISKYLPDKNIDLLDIDVEGLDESIIRSIDWKELCPRVVMVEKEIDNANENSKITYNETLISAGYRLVATTTKTSIYLMDI